MKQKWVADDGDHRAAAALRGVANTQTARLRAFPARSAGNFGAPMPIWTRFHHHEYCIGRRRRWGRSQAVVSNAVDDAVTAGPCVRGRARCCTAHAPHLAADRRGSCTRHRPNSGPSQGQLIRGVRGAEPPEEEEPIQGKQDSCTARGVWGQVAVWRGHGAAGT